MARARRQAKITTTSALHELELQGKWVVFISWLIAQIQGLGKENSRIVGNIIDVFGFEDQKWQVEPGKLYDYELSGYEIQFIVDRIEAEWKGESVPPVHAGNSHRLFTYLKDVLDAPVDAPEEVAE